jgi:2-polyprenyl-6-methoxyphenol hydroxylase-like FAD-dependent oxidoreductase
MTSSNQQQLPVIIVGAGPCGLVAGLALKQYGIPFVLIERANRSKICSNAGSGFELAPTAIDILQNRLGVDIYKFMNTYHGMKMFTIEGKLLRSADITPDYKGGSVNRAEMQNSLLEILFPTPEDEEGILFCGSGLETYREEMKEGAEGGRVVATLTSGQEITGCVLLACDGIHSRTRAVLHGGYDSNKDWETNSKVEREKDPRHFCNAMVYWGKTSAPRGSELELSFRKTQRKKGDENTPLNIPVVGFPTIRAPASAFIIPSQDGTMLNWAFTVYTEKQRFSKNNDGKDLTRRGGGPLTEEEKKKLFDFTSHGRKSESIMRGVKDFPMLEMLIAATPAADITEAGLFDRRNLELPFTSKSKLVALLGDAAHPQTPFLGQGVNMAITDAYMYATNIAVALNSKTKSLKEAISHCDTDIRRKQAESVVKNARQFCYLAISQNPLIMFFMRLYTKFAPDSEFMNQIAQSDGSNRHYLTELDEKLCSPKEQEGMRQKA